MKKITHKIVLCMALRYGIIITPNGKDVKTMSKNKLNIAVIGCHMGENHIKGIVEQENADLLAICDIDPARLEKCKNEYKPQIVTDDYRTLVNNPDLDAVAVVTPDQCHLEQTVAFMRAGKDVLCDKPMALTVEECEEMMRVEKETGRQLMIGQICRYTPAFMMAKKLVDEGRIGELVFVESEYAHCYEPGARGHNDWRVDPKRHGFIGGGCHAVDLLRWIAGDPTEVYALANHKILTNWPVDDTSIAIFKFPNNVMGKVFMSIGCRRNYTMRSVFYGTMGTIICDNTSPTLTLFEHKPEIGNYEFTKPQELPVDINNHNAAGEMVDFATALLEGKAMPVSSMEGAKTVAVCCAAVESAAAGKPIEIRYPKI